MMGAGRLEVRLPVGPEGRSSIMRPCGVVRLADGMDVARLNRVGP
jgi:hypothetical protein